MQELKSLLLKSVKAVDLNPEAGKTSSRKKKPVLPESGKPVFSIAGNDLLLDPGQQGGHFRLRVFYEVLAA